MRTTFLPARTVAAALAVAGALAGCAGGSATAKTGGPTTTGPVTATATGPASGSRPAVTPACAVSADPVPATGPAADAFGQKQVAAAYDFAADLLATTTFSEAPLADPQPPPEAFAAAEAGLTPRARDSFRILTGKLASTTEDLTPQENADLIGLASYGVTVAYPKLTLSEPAYRDVRCGAATTEVFKRAGQPDALVLRFPVSGTFLLTDPAGQPQTIGWRKQMGLTLAPTGEPARPWLVDGWRAALSLDGPKPDAAS